MDYRITRLGRPLRTRRGSLCAAVLLAGVALSGCRTRLWNTGAIEDMPAPDMTRTVDMVIPETSCRQVRSNKIDLLFAIDNSKSMDPMQLELVTRMPQFLKVLFDLAAGGTAVDLHLGVITSDYGAGASGTGGCDPSPGGQGGRLQALGAGAQPDCKPPVGADYIKFQFGPGGMNNLPPGQDLAKSFSCIAAVGADGCGMEHQLESTYGALHLKENEGFVRDDALLVIVFLTNEDDCSAPPDSDLFDESNGLKYGFKDSYLCTRFGVVCGDPPMAPPYGPSGGPLTNCRPAPNPDGKGPGKLYDVSRYVDYFTKPKAQGGLKEDPGNLLLVGIDAPNDPFLTILGNPTPMRMPKYMQCPKLEERNFPWCVPLLETSCASPNEHFFGDPAVRLNFVINAVANHATMPICDDDYSGSMQSIAKLALSRISECCLPAKLPDSSHPHCAVFDVTVREGMETETSIPDCAGHPNVFPCWRLEAKQTCSTAPQSLGVTVDRNGQPLPDHTTIRATCEAL